MIDFLQPTVIGNSGIPTVTLAWTLTFPLVLLVSFRHVFVSNIHPTRNGKMCCTFATENHQLFLGEPLLCLHSCIILMLAKGSGDAGTDRKHIDHGKVNQHVKEFFESLSIHTTTEPAMALILHLPTVTSHRGDDLGDVGKDLNLSS